MTKIFPPTYNWQDLKADATKSSDGTIPAQLTRRPWLLALWWQVAPHRYTADASRAFIEAVIPGWGI